MIFFFIRERYIRENEFGVLSRRGFFECYNHRVVFKVTENLI